MDLMAFLWYFVMWHGLKGSMFESKVTVILDELESLCVRPCKVLKSTSLYEGIMDWIKCGVHKNTPLQYHGIGGLMTTIQRKNKLVQHLWMMKLNNSCKLLCKAAAVKTIGH